MQDFEINAIHENELEEFLENIGILEDIKKGKIKCNFCKQIVKLDNFYSVYPKNNRIYVCCEKTQCRIKFKIETGKGED
jgi:hypothetical protein